MREIGNFNFIETAIEGVQIIEPRVYKDQRGFFMESFHQESFEKAGIHMNIVQMNISKSSRGVLRGLHFQKNYPQAKLVRVLSGEIYDVAVDLREGSSTYKKWIGFYLSHENNTELYIPRGCAHGFLVLSEEVEFSYMVDDVYHPEDEGGLLWNDSEIGVEWPIDRVKEIIMSDKDKKLKTLNQLEVN